MRSMTVYNFLLEATLLGSVLILLLCAARAFWRRRIGSRLIYAAWLLVALRLLVPLSLPNPLMNELRPELSTDMAARPVADQIRVRLIDAAWDISAALRAATGGSTVSEALEELGSQTYDGQTGRWLLLGYMAVSAVLICLMAARRYRRRHFIRRNRVAELSAQDTLSFHRLCVRFEVKPLPVYYVDRLCAPCTVGVLHPMIALPAATPKAHLPALLTHELAHLKGLDPYWKLVRNLCCAIHWFNPLVWLGALLSASDADLACDERACRVMSGSERLAYADALASSGNAMLTEPSLLRPSAPAQEKRLHRRMTAVLTNVHVKPLTAVLASLLCLCVLVCSFATEEKYAPVSISVVPKVLWHAGDERVETTDAAIAYTRRFLESPYVEVSTETMRFESALERGGDGAPLLWRVTGLSVGGQNDVLLRFYSDGTLMEYNGLSQIDDVDLSAREKAAPVPSASVQEYLRSFTDACLPHQDWVGVTSSDDVAGTEKRFLLFDLKLSNAGPSLQKRLYSAKLGALLDDTVRVVYYSMEING